MKSPGNRSLSSEVILLNSVVGISGLDLLWYLSVRIMWFSHRFFLLAPYLKKMEFFKWTFTLFPPSFAYIPKMWHCSFCNSLCYTCTFIKKKKVCHSVLWITDKFGVWDFLFFHFEIKFLVQYTGRNLHGKKWHKANNL